MPPVGTHLSPWAQGMQFKPKHPEIKLKTVKFLEKKKNIYIYIYISLPTVTTCPLHKTFQEFPKGLAMG